MAKKKPKHKHSKPAGGKPGTSPLALIGHYLAAPLQKEIAPAWRWLLPLLAVGWLLRVAVGVSGDFVIHPDEIMQYLEPAHRLAFGSGIAYWEFYYGARSWLTPVFVAFWLSLLSAVGLATPAAYIAVVKIAFCTLSLLAPYGMYLTGKHLYSERVARIALLLGVLWYELIGFAHKPMTEFVATPLALLLLAWITDPRPTTLPRCLSAVLLSVLIVAVRFQYAPVIAVMMLFYFIRHAHLRLPIIAAGLGGVALIGLFDYLTWGGFLYSYWVNLQVNVVLGGGREGESTPWHFLLYLTVASGGCFVLAAVAALQYKKHRFLIWLSAVLLIIHMWQAHREYRFIFAVIPLYLILFAYFINSRTPAGRAAAPGRDAPARLPLTLPQLGIGAYTLLVSLLGILNALPLQNWIYRAFSQEKGIVNFIRHQDPIFEIYRDLARDPALAGVWDSVHPYFNTGGYYYLHREVPFYDTGTFFAHGDLEKTGDYVSHIITAAPLTPAGLTQISGHLVMQTEEYGYLPLPLILNDATLNKPVYWDRYGQATPIDGFELAEKTYGSLSLWRKTADSEVQQWQQWVVYPDNEPMHDIVNRALNGNARPATPDAGITFPQ